MVFQHRMFSTASRLLAFILGVAIVFSGFEGYAQEPGDKKTAPESANTEAVPTRNDRLDSPPAPEQKGKYAEGRQIAILIGIQDYEHWSKLNNPISDVEAVAKDLIDIYGFDHVEIIRDPTRAELLVRLHQLHKEGGGVLYEKSKGPTEVVVSSKEGNLKPEDSVLIFVSGHGFYNKQLDDGVLIPVDAPRADSADFVVNPGISHGDFLTTIDGFSSSSIMVVMDTCHAGYAALHLDRSSRKGPPKNVSEAKLVQISKRYRGRFVITSGDKEKVSDGKPGQHSPFARAFLEILREDENDGDTILLGSQLSSEIEFKSAARSENENPGGEKPVSAPFKSNEPAAIFVLRQKNYSPTNTKPISDAKLEEMIGRGSSEARTNPGRPWVLGGGAAVVVGSGLIISSLVTGAQIQGSVDSGERTYEEALSLEQPVNSLRYAGIGVAALGVGVLSYGLFLNAKQASDKERGAMLDAREVQVLPGLGSLQLRVRF